MSPLTEKFFAADPGLEEYFLPEPGFPLGEIPPARPPMLNSELIGTLRRHRPDAYLMLTLVGMVPVLQLPLTGFRTSSSRSPSGESILTLEAAVGAMDTYFHTAPAGRRPAQPPKGPPMINQQLIELLESHMEEARLMLTLVGAAPVLRFPLTGVNAIQSRTPNGEFHLTLHCEDD